MSDKVALKILKMEKDKLMLEPEVTRDWELITALDIAIEALENKPDYDIIFLCDGKACGENHDCMECRHTLDIHHAKNFHYNPILFDKNYYLEVENEHNNSRT